MPRLVQLSVAGDVVVVAGEPEARLVAGNESGNGEWSVAARGTAMHDNQIYSSHNISHKFSFII